jgi:hypothetical protein
MKFDIITSLAIILISAVAAHKRRSEQGFLIFPLPVTATEAAKACESYHNSKLLEINEKNMVSAANFLYDHGVRVSHIAKATVCGPDGNKTTLTGNTVAFITSNSEEDESHTHRLYMNFEILGKKDAKTELHRAICVTDKKNAAAAEANHSDMQAFIRAVQLEDSKRVKTSKKKMSPIDIVASARSKMNRTLAQIKKSTQKALALERRLTKRTKSTEAKLNKKAERHVRTVTKLTKKLARIQGKSDFTSSKSLQKKAEKIQKKIHRKNKKVGTDVLGRADMLLADAAQESEEQSAEPNERKFFNGVPI